MQAYDQNSSSKINNDNEISDKNDRYQRYVSATEDDYWNEDDLMSNESDLLDNEASEIDYESDLEIETNYDHSFGYKILDDLIDLFKDFRVSCPDGKTKFYEDCDYNKETFANDMMLFLHRNSSHKRSERELLVFWNKYHPASKGYNLPIKVNRKGYVESDLDSYKVSSKQGLRFDICKTAGCTVYIGNNMHLYKCVKCHMPRYNDCTHPKCKPFIENNCFHRMNPHYRTVIKSMTYRPLHSIFGHLLNTRGFLFALRYSQGHQDGLRRDLTDSPHCQKHIQEMHNKYLASGKTDYEEVNILLSEFYDGAQIYKRKHSSFYPFLIGILNLPPSYRGKLGVGLFLISLFSSKAGSAAELFIFNCLVQELTMFFEGVEFFLNGKKYFVQARLVLHICDTIGLQSILRCQGVNSYCGCSLCECGRGVWRVDLNKMVHMGARGLLDEYHCLRFKGIISSCCPENYYLLGDTQKEQQNDFFNNKNTGHCCNTKLDASYLRSIAKKDRLWHHKIFSYEIFDKHLRYHYCDFRDKSEWKRRPNEFHIEKGREALQSGKVVDGIKGLWVFFCLLYANISKDIDFDPMHILKNWGEHLLAILLGKRCKASNLQRYFQKCGIKDWKPGQYPWELSRHDRLRIDCMLECINIPKGYSKNLDVKRICQEKWAIKASGYITILTALLPFIASGAHDLPRPYRAFLEMNADDFTDLLAVEIDPNNIEELFLRIKELLCIKEGLFPDSEAQTTFHQILHLRSTLENFGPLRTAWSMAGERSINRIKEYCKRNYEQNNLTVYNNYELMQLQQAYNFSLTDLFCEKEMQSITNDPSKVFVHEGMLFYDDKMIYIENMEFPEHKLDPYESNNLVCSLLLEIFDLAGQDLTRAFENSVLFRLFQVFVEENIEDEFNVNFFTFLQEINIFRLKNLNTLLQQKIGKLTDGELGKECNLENLHKIEENLTWVPVYRKAVVYGIKFKSRGIEYCETKEPVLVKLNYGSEQSYRVYFPSKEVNNLAIKWKESKSSWAKIRVFKDFASLKKSLKNGPRVGAIESVRYVQNNYFFSMNMTEWGEKLVDNILFASVSARFVKENRVYCVEKVESGQQIRLYDSMNAFVPLSNYFSTAVAFCAFGKSKNGEILPCYNKISKDTFLKGKEKYLCDSNELKAEHLYMIDVHPERRCIRKKI
jgi:hypothetical protein